MFTAVNMEGHGSTEDIDTAAKQLTLQIEDLSIENEEGDIPTAMASTDKINSASTCAACGKEGEEGSMNICNKCKMVHYCNVACKKKHKSKHKKKCDRRVAELHDEALFNESPPREECPICMLPLPLDGSTFHPCCGKLICDGCIYAMTIEGVRKGTKKEEMGMCAFCRTLRPISNEEEVRRVKKLMKSGNADACKQLAGYYADGVCGMQQDIAKATELWLKAGELGCAEGYYNLGNSYYYGRGVEIDKKKAKHYWELAAMTGDVDARYNLGCMEGRAGNHERAYKHYILSAKGGYKGSLEFVKKGFTKGFVTKDEYESTLRAHHECQAEMKSEMRDKAADLMAQHQAAS